MAMRNALSAVYKHQEPSEPSLSWVGPHPPPPLGRRIDCHQKRGFPECPCVSIPFELSPTWEDGGHVPQTCGPVECAQKGPWHFRDYLLGTD